MLSFFADQCLAYPFIKTLRENSCQVTLLREKLSQVAEDPIVIQKAQELGQILLTQDGDFGNIVQYPPKNFKGIVIVQMKKPEQIPDLQLRLIHLIQTYKNPEEYSKKLFIVDTKKIRIRL